MSPQGMTWWPWITPTEKSPIFITRVSGASGDYAGSDIIGGYLITVARDENRGALVGRKRFQPLLGFPVANVPRADDVLHFGRNEQLLEGLWQVDATLWDVEVANEQD